MVKILTCPNCGNNKNLITNNNTTVCSSCGYSWVSVSNRNIKSSEIKVVMDSANHYRYTLDNYNDDEHTFPFYAIHNNFIENKSSNRNRLIRVNPLDEKSVKQNYVGVSKLNPRSKRPIIRYSDNIDLSMYQKPISQRVVSDRTNQEYEILRENNQKHNNEYTTRENYSIHSRDVDNTVENNTNNRENLSLDRPTPTPRSQNSINRERDNHERGLINPRENNYEYIKRPLLNRNINELNYLNEFAEKDPERFFKEYEVTKVNKDGSVEVQPKQSISQESRDMENSKEYTQNEYYENQQNTQNHNNNYDNSWQNENNFNSNVEQNSEYVRPEPTTPRVKKERLSEEQKIYKAQLRERLERSQREREQHRIREREITEQSGLKIQVNEPLTYEKYKENRTQKALEAKEQQKIRSERIKNKEYISRTSSNKYPRSEKKYSRKKEVSNVENTLEQNKPIKDYREKYLTKDVFETDNFNREALANNNISKKLRLEIDNITEKNYNPTPKTYEKKPRDSKYTNETRVSNAYNPSNLDDMINNISEIDEDIINANPPKNLFGKNPRLSFFENLKINSDGTIKEDPLGLNQDYNEFFNKNGLALGEKKYNLKEIVAEIKKRINKDKMSFNLVILVIIFGFFGMLSHYITKSHSDKNNNKMVTELDIGKDFANQIPIIDDNPKLKGANGTSDALVIGKTVQDKDSKETINATSKEDSQEITLQGKKNIASDLSLEELRNNKLADLDKTKSSSTKNTTSFMNKAMMYFQQKTTQIFSDVNVVVTSSKWKNDNNGKYFEINININNKSTNRSYTINTLEITLLDISGNVIGIREIYPNKTLRVKETTSSIIRIPKAPDLSANAYVKIAEIR